MKGEKFSALVNYLQEVPAVNVFGSGIFENGLWWIKFNIDIKHSYAWQVVQEIGHVVNYVSLEERLPTVFYPVSPPPYINGGPDEFLSWIIESEDADFTPDDLKDWLFGRLPQPVNDLKSWSTSNEEDWKEV
ncbi:hypothetical protein G7092_29570 [Mucilaginibacter sp. HC2]|uniref:hypothetical protein n=1 Tax=Mucilaginibacter inviolabilis TaxID=2714892 RepID=UPI00140CF41C|nr:hypothetical protein [Mucilaginibacter inviolabilis]NHA07986.1 hypothetical protein [Mucilaginibacter inviolabilis]